MGRVTGFIAMAVVIGVATGLVLDRVVVVTLVGGGVFLLGVTSHPHQPSRSGRPLTAGRRGPAHCARFQATTSRPA